MVGVLMLLCTDIATLNAENARASLAKKMENNFTLKKNEDESVTQELHKS
jgi:hypothetical protein